MNKEEEENILPCKWVGSKKERKMFSARYDTKTVMKRSLDANGWRKEGEKLESGLFRRSNCITYDFENIVFLGLCGKLLTTFFCSFCYFSSIWSILSFAVETNSLWDICVDWTRVRGVCPKICSTCVRIRYHLRMEVLWLLRLSTGFANTGPQVQAPICGSYLATPDWFVSSLFQRWISSVLKLGTGQSWSWIRKHFWERSFCDLRNWNCYFFILCC